MKGICFIEPMQRATVAGWKRMTRRIMSPQPLGQISAAALRPAIRSDRRPRINSLCSEPTFARFIPGEVVYIKEPFIDDMDLDGRIFYKYEPSHAAYMEQIGENYGWKCKLLMPASAARYFIRITGVHGERLQDISDADCRAEGIFSDALELNFGLPNHNGTALETILGRSWREAFAALIDSVSGEGTWVRNPWVWVYEFEFLTQLTEVERRYYNLPKP